MTAHHGSSSSADPGVPHPDVAMRHVWLGALHHLAWVDGHHLNAAERQQLRHWSHRLEVGEELVSRLQSDCGEQPRPTARPLDPVRDWLDAIEPREPAVTRLLVKPIPAQCPIERDVVVFGRKLAHIPPLCQINPLFDQLMGLRFRCLCFLEGEEPPAQSETGAG